MIKLKVELYPAGSEEHKRTIGEIVIWNRCDSGSSKIGNYNYKVISPDGNFLVEGRLDNFIRQKGAFKLVEKLFMELFDE